MNSKKGQFVNYYAKVQNLGITLNQESKKPPILGWFFYPFCGPDGI
ncbi:MAG TPA: hypothetical protein P5080_03405 [Candidatus Paceibacterota bacterium]|nr:hypothetical protein [Candidatus Pacearchaeota archaeon]HRZ51012.1 hypothetical protein [Candidatus Paceibacterota bacterium]HSA36733.1 hypothetical protein [Candidatus Paceibacterota bacterium]